MQLKDKPPSDDIGETSISQQSVAMTALSGPGELEVDSVYYKTLYGCL